MRLKLSPSQWQALAENEYLDDDQTAVEISRDRHLHYTDKIKAHEAITDAANAADSWAEYWSKKKEGAFAGYERRMRRSLTALASRILRSP